MGVVMVGARMRLDAVGEVEEGAGRMFAAIDAARPETVRYGSWKMPDGGTSVAIVELGAGADDGRNRLIAILEFAQFEDRLAGWLDAPPTPQQSAVVGSYRSFSPA